ncbi:uncharacterized protein BKA55DRAFT_198473 [Fusarium redolens]|uniref:Secreted protein n=1 Tax=Fusarium redolens TaxID=48865 RepID=A0A9P9JS76_FUSRE|nr:uncharacterized protein BKA55DRAFT_198473 [Fusarium redolens]KAH7231356.1 hypothetical protein BKA55DRAFT_198473 [Fusarium redolens]
MVIFFFPLFCFALVAAHFDLYCIEWKRVAWLGLTHKTIRAQRLHHHRCCTFHQDFRAGSSYNKPQQATTQTHRLRYLVFHPYELIRQTQGLRQNAPEE